MKITASNSVVLEELHSRLKIAKFKVLAIKKPSDDKEKFDLKDLVQLILDNPEESQLVLETILDELTSLYRQEHIYIERKDGKMIPYSEYKEMTLEAKSEFIF